MAQATLMLHGGGSYCFTLSIESKGLKIADLIPSGFSLKIMGDTSTITGCNTNLQVIQEELAVFLNKLSQELVGVMVNPEIAGLICAWMEPPMNPFIFPLQHSSLE